MSASGKRLLAACIFALCSIPVLIVYTWVFTPDLIPHEGIWYCEELDATWDLNTSSGTIQVNGKQKAFVSLHQFYCRDTAAGSGRRSSWRRTRQHRPFIVQCRFW